MVVDFHGEHVLAHVAVRTPVIAQRVGARSQEQREIIQRRGNRAVRSRDLGNKVSERPRGLRRGGYAVDIGIVGADGAKRLLDRIPFLDGAAQRIELDSAAHDHSILSRLAGSTEHGGILLGLRLPPDPIEEADRVDSICRMEHIVMVRQAVGVVGCSWKVPKGHHRVSGALLIRAGNRGQPALQVIGI